MYPIPLDYDQITPGYDRRYRANPLAGGAYALGELAETRKLVPEQERRLDLAGR